MAARREILARQISRFAPPSEQDGLNDAELLGRFVAGRDETAFSALVSRHGPLVLHVCRRVLGNVHDAEDAFQATFLVLARKASSIRPPEGLAGWLHGVARRVALKARTVRTRRTRGVKLPVSPRAGVSADPLVDLSARELLDLIDLEIGRLPEVYRLPVILCCLEGHSQEEAAHRLGWTGGSVKGRLERGRALLHTRLSRRGLTLSTTLAVVELSRGVGSAAVVGQLCGATVGAALAFASGSGALGGASMSAAKLAGGVARTLAWERVKIPVVLLLIGGLVSVGIAAHQLSLRPQPRDIAVRASPPIAEGSRSDWTPPPDIRNDPAGPWPEAAAQPIQVSGRVLDPAGQPYSGARLYVGYAPRRCDLTAPFAGADYPVRGTSGQDGVFGFTFARSELNERCLDSSRPVVVAVADGFGLAWAEIADAGLIHLRLVDDHPIEGRIVDRAGNPVVGARLSVREVVSNPAGGLPREVPTNDYSSVRISRGPLPGLAPSQRTGADGRFRLTGLGRNRLVVLALDGPSIAPVGFTIATTSSPPRQFMGATFEHVAAPSRPIRGVVRDSATGQPLAGVRMSLDPFGPAVVTDAEGRYELHCHVSSTHTVLARPQGEEPFFAATARPRGESASGPLNVDVDLVGGIPLGGRVTDRTTGKPPRQAVVMYYPLGSNSRSTALTTSNWAAPSSALVRPDGSYTLAVLPGPGVVLVAASPRDLYASAILSEQGLAAGGESIVDEGSVVEIALGVHRERRSVARYSAIALINPEERAAKVALDLTVEPARAVRGMVVGPDGSPLTGVRVSGLTSGNDTETLDHPSFTVEGLHPRGARHLVFQHVEKGLGKVATVRGDRSDELTVQLDPFGAVTGRIVDKDGKPKPDVLVSLVGRATGMLATDRTDRDGRFRVNLATGQQYSLESRTQLRGAPITVEVESSRTENLGDLVVDR
jgi:RNA polymerase sigma factor (sigma-70 family)